MKMSVGEHLQYDSPYTVANQLQDTSDAEAFAGLGFEDSQEEQEAREKLINELIEFYGGQLFKYGSHTGTINDIIYSCPASEIRLLGGFDTVVAWIEPFKVDSLEEPTVDDKENDKPTSEDKDSQSTEKNITETDQEKTKTIDTAIQETPKNNSIIPRDTSEVIRPTIDSLIPAASPDKQSNYETSTRKKVVEPESVDQLADARKAVSDAYDLEDKEVISETQVQHTSTKNNVSTIPNTPKESTPIPPTNDIDTYIATPTPPLTPDVRTSLAEADISDTVPNTRDEILESAKISPAEIVDPSASQELVSPESSASFILPEVPVTEDPEFNILPLNNIDQISSELESDPVISRQAVTDIEAQLPSAEDSILPLPAESANTEHPLDEADTELVGEPTLTIDSSDISPFDIPADILVAEVTDSLDAKVEDQSVNLKHTEAYVRITFDAIESLKQATSAEECKDSLEDLKLALEDLLESVDYDQPAETADRIIRDYDIDSIHEIVMKLQMRVQHISHSNSLNALKTKHRIIGHHAIRSHAGPATLLRQFENIQDISNTRRSYLTQTA